MSGVYRTISRLNHSCAPNVVWSWIKRDKSKVAKQVRVIRKIREGEELLVRYWGAHEFASKDERQDGLSPWDFSCTCEVCSLTGDELIDNEEARMKIRTWCEAINVQFHSGLPKLAYKLAKSRVKVMMSIEKEMVVELPAALMECCELAACCKLPSSSTTELRKKAKNMSELFGDYHLYNYNKYPTSHV